MSSCDTEYTRDTKTFQGFPGYQVHSGLVNKRIIFFFTGFQPGYVWSRGHNWGLSKTKVNDWQMFYEIQFVHMSRYIGQSWGPWQFFTGTVVRSFRLNNVATNFNAFNGNNAFNSLNNIFGVSCLLISSFDSTFLLQSRLQPVAGVTNSANPEFRTKKATWFDFITFCGKESCLWWNEI